MKRIFHFAGFMAMAVAATFFTACSSADDGNDKGSNTPPESADVTSFGQIEYLQNNIVETDQSGNMLQRVNGAVLNPADTTELYIGIEDLITASAMFKSMTSHNPPKPMPAPRAADARPATSMSIPLTDENGVVKETAYFNAVEDGQTIAEVTFATNKVMKHFSKIKFIKVSAWPDNDASPYAAGDTATFETANEGMQKWVCIREAKCGVSGLMMYISRQECDYSSIRNMGCASESLAKTASEILRANWQMYVTCFSKTGRTLDGSCYWIKAPSKYREGQATPAIRLQDGVIETSVHKNRYIQIRTFGV